MATRLSRSSRTSTNGTRSTASAIGSENTFMRESEPLLSVSVPSYDVVLFDDDLELPTQHPQQQQNDRRRTPIRHLTLPTREGLQRNFKRRCLTRKSVISILVLNFLGSYAFYGITQSSVIHSVFKDSTLHIGKDDPDLLALLKQVLKFGLAYVFYPLGGILADVYLGRHRSARLCLLIVWVTCGLLAISAAIGNTFQLESSAESVVKDIFVTWLPLACLVLYAIASGVFQLSLLVFGGDQLFDAPSDTVSSYIYWYYWTRNAANFLGFVVYMAITALKPLDNEIKGFNFVPVLQPILSVTVLTVAIVFDTCTSTLYDAEHKNTNPVRLVCGVIYNSRQWRQPPPFRSAFRYGEDPPSGLDYARQHHGGKYTDEEVEDVRTFGRIMVFLLSLSGYMMLYYALENMVSYQISHCAMNASQTILTGSISAHEVEIYTFDLFQAILNCFFVILLVPLCNSLLFPLLGFYVPNMRKRIGFGISLVLISSVMSIFLEFNTRQDPVFRILWFVLLVFMVSFAEVSTAIPLLEFVYAQSPDNMKGLLTGVYYFLFGVWNTIMNIIIYLFTKNNYRVDKCSSQPSTNPTLWYYTGVTVIGGVMCILYFIVAYKYKNRTRNNPISDIMRVSMCY